MAQITWKTIEKIQEEIANRPPSMDEKMSELLLENARKEIDNKKLKAQNADILLKLARNNIN